MAVRHGLFTSESVSGGHSDTLWDRLSEAILDEFLKRDPNTPGACEAPSMVRRVLTEIGYRDSDQDISPAGADVEVRFNHRSRQIASAVDGGESLGAGDQGLMFGYSARETGALAALSWTLANELIASATSLTQDADAPLRADGKSRVTVRYQEGRSLAVQSVALSWQHSDRLSLKEVRGVLQQAMADRVVPPSLRTEDLHFISIRLARGRLAVPTATPVSPDARSVSTHTGAPAPTAKTHRKSIARPPARPDRSPRMSSRRNLPSGARYRWLMPSASPSPYRSASVCTAAETPVKMRSSGPSGKCST